MAIQILSPLDKRIIEVTLNPETSGLPVKEKCEIAGCCKDSWYRIMKKPAVLQAINDGSLLIIRDNIIPLINKTMEFAMENKSNHQDRKYLFQLLGMLKESSATVNVNTQVNDGTVISNPFDGLSKDDLQLLISKYKDNPTTLEKDINNL